MEDVLQSQIMKHIEAHGILSDQQQHGFRKRRSCESQLILTVHDLASEMDEGQQTDGHPAWLKQDTAWTPCCQAQILWYTRQHSAMDSKLTTRYKSASPYRRPGQSCTSVPVVYGRPQGTVLGSLLFLLFFFFFFFFLLLYINDLPQNELHRPLIPWWKLPVPQDPVQPIQQSCRGIWTSSNSGHRTGRCHLTPVRGTFGKSCNLHVFSELSARIFIKFACSESWISALSSDKNLHEKSVTRIYKWPVF